MKAKALAASFALAILSPLSAHAFCGFYVDGAGATLVNDATQVVLMRDGTRTAMSIQNDYKGPPSDFALVVPVPVVLQKENVKTLSKEVFARIEQLSSPRLVEYWERDPCAKEQGLGDIGTLGHGSGAGAGFGNGHGRLGGASVTVEAQFEVGEYEIVILSAQDSTGLDRWLRTNGYKIPPNADKALAPYVAAGSKFFVAKVNVAKVKMENGRASLSPLRFHYDSDKFELPVKLGLLNSAGTQDLVVYVLANDRYEVANAPNVTIPTNLDVSENARKSFGAFYAALFDDTVAKHPGAVVTEYAWQTSNCDPCPGNAVGVSPSDLASLGADALPGIWWSAIGGRGSGVTVRAGKVTVTGGLPDAVVQRIVRQNFGRFRLCYENGLRGNPELRGRVSVKFGIDASGSVVGPADAGSEMKDASVVSCVVRGFGNLSFPEPVEKQKTSVTYELDFAGAATAPPQPAQIPKGPVILTRLHTRYGKDALGNDLVFRVAPPIVGGREDAARGAKLDTGAKTTTGASNFQARYVIRHTWPGAVACDNPQRGIWGGPWPDAGVAPDTQIATSLAYAPRGGGITLASFTGGAVPDVPITNGDAGSALASEAGGDAGAAPTATPSRCGCRAVGSDRSSGGFFALAALAALAARRRRAKPKTIDDYLARQPADRRAALEKLREVIHAIVPDAEECIRYSMPAFRVGGRVVAGFQATSKGCSYYPFSGRTLATLASDLGRYDQTKSALHFDPKRPLPKVLVRKLLEARLAESSVRA